MISVIISAYNAEETIERALDSVRGQSYHDLEIIVVDDGSTDGTAAITEFFAQRDPRVRLVRLDHSGPGAARNAGIETATGEWLSFLEAGDELTPDAFEIVLDRVGSEEVGLAIFSINTIRDYIYAWPPPDTGVENSLYRGDGERANTFVHAYLQKTQMLMDRLGNKLFRRRVIEDHQVRFPEHLQFGEDQIFAITYLRHAGTVLTMGDPLYIRHHGRPGSRPTAPTSSLLKTVLTISEARMQLFRDYGYTDEELEELRRHESRQILSEGVRELLHRDRFEGSGSLRRSVRAVREARLDPRFFAADAAATRRIRLVQCALRTRQDWIVFALIHVLRRREDQSIFQRRSREIDRDQELARLSLTGETRRERDRYYYLADYERFLDRINPEQHRNLLRDKAILLRRLTTSPDHDFLRRQWLDLRRATREEFAALVKRSDRIVAKLFNGTWSNGTEVIDTTSAELDTDALFEELIERKQYVVEEYLPQHADLARFYPGALASMRIHTLNLGGEAQLILPTTANFGSRGGTTSNAWTILAFFDLQTGTITSDGLYQGYVHGRPDEVFERHPDSEVPFRGSVIPFAAETRELVLGAARRVPELPLIGWDVAYTPDGPVIIEGNGAPVIHYTWQIALRRLFGMRGMRATFDQIFDRVMRYQRDRYTRAFQSSAQRGALQ